MVEKLFPKIDSEGVFLADNQKGVTRNRIPGKLFSCGGEKSVNDGVALLMDPLVGSLASVRACQSSHWILPFIPKVIVIAKNLIENSQNFSDALFSSTLSQFFSQLSMSLDQSDTKRVPYNIFDVRAVSHSQISNLKWVTFGRKSGQLNPKRNCTESVFIKGLFVYSTHINVQAISGVECLSTKLARIE